MAREYACVSFVTVVVVAVLLFVGVALPAWFVVLSFADAASRISLIFCPPVCWRHSPSEYFVPSQTGLLGDGGFSFNPKYANDEIKGFTPVKKRAGETSLRPTAQLYNYTVRD
ncbi:MAG TPA: hypothetical protein VFT58_01270 [Nitrososphaera sp.]|nr:hypothetical protein [Nitrososphaera sp.]